MRVAVETTIDAPADAVWQIVGPRFADIGQWASAIRSSRAAHAEPSDRTAPVDGRVCETGLRIAPRVTETIVAYDDAARTLTYEGDGLPAFVTLARNRWRVTAIAPGRCVLSLDATVELRGAARILAPALRVQFRREGRRLARDLKHYAERGEPSARKRRRDMRRGHPG
jgi:polyketide cyclase/dehydrase/lipid transport protein